VTTARTTCTYHCSACGLHTHSLEAFDNHRVGEYEPAPGEVRRHCISPHDDEAVDGQGRPLFIALTNNGTCNIYANATKEGVTIWTSARSQGRILKHLAQAREI
jgi:hypothetical protein